MAGELVEAAVRSTALAFLVVIVQASAVVALVALASILLRQVEGIESHMATLLEMLPYSVYDVVAHPLYNLVGHTSLLIVVMLVGGGPNGWIWCPCSLSVIPRSDWRKQGVVRGQVSGERHSH